MSPAKPNRDDEVVLLEPLVRIAAEKERLLNKSAAEQQEAASWKHLRQLTVINQTPLTQQQQQIQHTRLQQNQSNDSHDSNWWHLIHYSNVNKWPTFNENSWSQLLQNDRDDFVDFWSWPFASGGTKTALDSYTNETNSYRNLANWTQKLLANLARRNWATKHRPLLVASNGWTPQLFDQIGLQLEQNSTNANDYAAQLSCDSGEMVLRLNFSQPFRGIVYPDHNRLSACRFFGDGHLNYELRLPLKGCGTRQVSVETILFGRRTSSSSAELVSLGGKCFLHSLLQIGLPNSSNTPAQAAQTQKGKHMASQRSQLDDAAERVRARIGRTSGGSFVFGELASGAHCCMRDEELYLSSGWAVGRWANLEIICPLECRILAHHLRSICAPAFTLGALLATWPLGNAVRSGH